MRWPWMSKKKFNKLMLERDQRQAEWREEIRKESDKKYYQGYADGDAHTRFVVRQRIVDLSLGFKDNMETHVSARVNASLRSAFSDFS